MTKIFIRLIIVLFLTVVLVGCTETSFTEPTSSSMSTTSSMPMTSTITQAITTSGIQTSTSSTAVSSTQTTTAVVTSQITSTTIQTTTPSTIVTTSPPYQEFSLLNGTPFTLVNFNPLATHTAYTQEFINDELHIQPTKFHKLDQLTKDLSQMNLSSTKKLIITAKG
ncbi:MAG: hypothetical protein U1C51_00145, partial [Candidatus Izemoplasmatales bacterium]|nr:hypothetical protein [Candidatus Izemoplasmatales bacterium]